MSKTTYYRYEMLYKGKHQDFGFMMGCDKAGVREQEGFDVTKKFRDELEIPKDIHLFPSTLTHYAGCYFTEKGKEYFQTSIDALIQLIESRSNGEWTVVCRTATNPKKEELYYSDEYQVVLKTDYRFPISIPYAIAI